ncbi:unnamed protein product [Orchesella dallaii]|uniref:Uncharacterized protein n=1 Tax=Orchesella dallaii TaxID=48710 RepID=A0ABP1RPU9_9HEXA
MKILIFLVLLLAANITTETQPDETKKEPNIENPHDTTAEFKAAIDKLNDTITEMFADQATVHQTQKQKQNLVRSLRIVSRELGIMARSLAKDLEHYSDPDSDKKPLKPMDAKNSPMLQGTVPWLIGLLE